jgi:hypothetical protein
MPWPVAGWIRVTSARTARRVLAETAGRKLGKAGDPYGTRTRVFAVRGRRPRPLDEGAVRLSARGHMAGRGGFVNQANWTSLLPSRVASQSATWAAIRSAAWPSPKGSAGVAMAA